MHQGTCRQPDRQRFGEGVDKMPHDPGGQDKGKFQRRHAGNHHGTAAARRDPPVGVAQHPAGQRLGFEVDDCQRQHDPDRQIDPPRRKPDQAARKPRPFLAVKLPGPNAAFVAQPRDAGVRGGLLRHRRDCTRCARPGCLGRGGQLHLLP